MRVVSIPLSASYIVVKGEVGLGALRNPEHAVRPGVGVNVEVGDRLGPASTATFGGNAFMVPGNRNMWGVVTIFCSYRQKWLTPLTVAHQVPSGK